VRISSYADRPYKKWLATDVSVRYVNESIGGLFC